MKYRAFVDGQEGTTGLRIHEYLAQRDDIEVLRIDADKRKDAAERARLLDAADVAFLCLPDAAAREAAALVSNPETCVIDASTAHRTAPGWVFGLPGLAPDQRERLRSQQAHRQSRLPFLRLHPADAAAGRCGSGGRLDSAISATSITGYSGGGKKMIETYKAGGNPRLDAPMPYGLRLDHKHVPEMARHSGLSTPPVFMPIVGPFYKGLAVSIPLHFAQLAGNTSGRALHDALSTRYADERFIRVMPLSDPGTLESTYFDVQACNDTNRVDIFVFANETQAILIARLDNLGKGASGAAVQTMNVHLGIEESKGL